MVNSHHTLANMERVINAQQSGAAPEMSIKEQIAMLDQQIHSTVSFIEYYQSKRAAKRMSKAQIAAAIHSHELTAAHLTEKREELKARYYADAISDQTNRIRDGLNTIADMTPEMEAAMNELVERRQVQA